MKFLYLLFFLALPISLAAQSNYNAGYVIKMNGDTVKGYIDYREWERSPRQINFKINLTDKNYIHFDPANAKAFEISGSDKYISYMGDISMDKTEFPDLPFRLDTSQVADTIFLRQLVAGKYITLYYNGDKIKKRYFIGEANKVPAELRYHEYYTDENSTRRSTVYKGQLLLYINEFAEGNQKLIESVDQSTFEQASLEDIVKDINGDHSKNKKGIDSRFFAGLAVNDTKTQLYNSLNIAGNISPKISAGFDLFNNSHVQQFFFRAELSFSYIKPKFDLYYGDKYSFDQYTASFTPQLVFNVFNKDSFKLYIDAGASFNFSAYANNIETLALNQQIINPYHFNTTWTSFPLQAGVVFNKKIEVFFSYTGYADYTQYIGFYTESKTFSTGVKYLMK